MKTDPSPLSPPVFLQTVSLAVAQLKQRLQNDYEQAYPALAEIVHLVIDEEEARAWELTLFPHLVLPDLVEAHITKLNLPAAKTSHRPVPHTRRWNEFATFQPALVLCG